MREWKACEVIVKQREKEMQSVIFAKLSSGSSIDSHVLRLIHRDSTMSNEVSHLHVVLWMLVSLLGVFTKITSIRKWIWLTSLDKHHY